MASADKPRDAPLKNVGIAPGLADEIDRFIGSHPEFGIKFRNEFANQACQHFLHVLHNRAYVALILETAKDGKAGRLDALLKAGRDELGE